jgi:hypothetical protein
VSAGVTHKTNCLIGAALKYKVFKDIVDRSVKEGGTQIEYEDEDPKIRQLFETELAKRGLQSRMT